MNSFCNIVWLTNSDGEFCDKLRQADELKQTETAKMIQAWMSRNKLRQAETSWWAQENWDSQDETSLDEPRQAETSQDQPRQAETSWDKQGQAETSQQELP